jgi:hypothetical protein
MGACKVSLFTLYITRNVESRKAQMAFTNGSNPMGITFFLPFHYTPTYQHIFCSRIWNRILMNSKRLLKHLHIRQMWIRLDGYCCSPWCRWASKMQMVLEKLIVLIEWRKLCKVVYRNSILPKGLYDPTKTSFKVLWKNWKKN